MKLLSLFLIVSFFIPSLQAQENAYPEKGYFDYTRFSGEYAFGKCITKNATPIWSSQPDSTYILITLDYRATPWKLHIGLINPGSPLGVGKFFDHVNEGEVTKVDSRTNRKINWYENYTTKNGIFARNAWNRQASGGWMTLEIFMDGQNNVGYKMKLKTRYDELDFAREEICSLERIK